MIPLIFIKDIMVSNTDPLNKDNSNPRYKNQELRLYNVGTYEFPDGLQNRDDLQHYVAFFINVRENSEIAQGVSNNKLYTLPDRENRLSSEQGAAATSTLLNNAGTIGALIGFLSNIKKGIVPATGGAGPSPHRDHGPW